MENHPARCWPLFLPCTRGPLISEGIIMLRLYFLKPRDQTLGVTCKLKAMVRNLHGMSINNNVHVMGDITGV